MRNQCFRDLDMEGYKIKNVSIDQFKKHPTTADKIVGYAYFNTEEEVIYYYTGNETNPWKAGGDGAVGPKGEKGDTGEVGPKGDDGDKGEQGERGLQGEAGKDGAVGEQGIEGPRGERGDRGPQGDRGLQGPEGPEGKQGIEGKQGEKGSDATVLPDNITTSLNTKGEIQVGISDVPEEDQNIPGAIYVNNYNDGDFTTTTVVNNAYIIRNKENDEIALNLNEGFSVSNTKNKNANSTNRAHIRPDSILGNISDENSDEYGFEINSYQVSGSNDLSRKSYLLEADKISVGIDGFSSDMHFPLFTEDQTKTFPFSVNGILADEKGDIALPAAGKPLTFSGGLLEIDGNVSIGTPIEVQGQTVIYPEIPLIESGGNKVMSIGNQTELMPKMINGENYKVGSIEVLEESQGLDKMKISGQVVYKNDDGQNIAAINQTVSDTNSMITLSLLSKNSLSCVTTYNSNELSDTIESKVFGKQQGVSILTQDSKSLKFNGDIYSSGRMVPTTVNNIPADEDGNITLPTPTIKADNSTISLNDSGELKLGGTDGIIKTDNFSLEVGGNEAIKVSHYAASPLSSTLNLKSAYQGVTHSIGMDGKFEVAQNGKAFITKGTLNHAYLMLGNDRSIVMAYTSSPTTGEGYSGNVVVDSQFEKEKNYIKSPDGSTFEIKVANDGTLSTIKL